MSGSSSPSRATRPPGRSADSGHRRPGPRLWGSPRRLLALANESENKRGLAVDHLQRAIAGDAANDDAWRRLDALYTGLHMESARPELAAKYRARFGRELR